MLIAFLLNTSPTNLTPFPLYGSGLRKPLILAATWPKVVYQMKLTSQLIFSFSDIVSKVT
jgi:hypothetical protein